MQEVRCVVRVFGRLSNRNGVLRASTKVHSLHVPPAVDSHRSLHSIMNEIGRGQTHNARARTHARTHAISVHVCGRRPLRLELRRQLRPRARVWHRMALVPCRRRRHTRRGRGRTRISQHFRNAFRDTTPDSGGNATQRTGVPQAQQARTCDWIVVHHGLLRVQRVCTHLRARPFRVRRPAATARAHRRAVSDRVVRVLQARAVRRVVVLRGPTPTRISHCPARQWARTTAFSARATPRTTRARVARGVAERRATPSTPEAHAPAT